MTTPYSEPPTRKNWVFEAAEPALTVEVTLLSAPGAHVDWVRGEQRDEAIRVIVDRCAAAFESEIDGQIEHVRHSNFNHHGMTVHLVVAARNSEQVANVVERHISALERTLEARLQSHFGWEQAAVSVQIEPHPSYQARFSRGSTKTNVGGEIAVYQPPGGSNAIAPVVVTVPSQAVAVCDPPLQAQPYPRERSNAAVAGLLGALVAIGIAVLVSVAIGPLVDRISQLDHRQMLAREQIHLRNQRIASLEAENGRLNNTIARLASRRGQPAMRGDQPTRALPDTDTPAVTAIIASSDVSAPATGAP